MSNLKSSRIQRKEAQMKEKANIVQPFIYTVPSISIICYRILFFLFLQLVMLFVTKSYSAIFVVTSAILGSACACALNYLIYREPIYNVLPIIIQGVLIGFLLPESYPLITTFFITFLTLFISRSMIFKSINCWFNVVVLAIVFAWFIGAQYFPPFQVTLDLMKLKNPSVYLIQNGSFKILEFDSSITQFLNSYVFKFFKINIPEGFVSLFWDTHSPIPAFRFNLLTIIASIFLFSDNSMNITIPAIFFFVYVVLVRLFAPFLIGGSFNSGDIILAVLTSGTLFTTIFLLQWFGTTPITMPGKIVFAILTGIVAFLITGCGTSPIGMVYTVMVSNLLNLMIRFFEEKNNKILLSKVLTKTLNNLFGESAK